MNLANVTPELWWVVLIVVGSMVVGSTLRLLALRGRTDQKARDRRGSLKTWWSVVAMVVAIVIFGRSVAIVIFAAISLFGFLEFMRMQRAGDREGEDPSRSTTAAGGNGQRRVIALGLVLIVLHYLCLWLEATEVATVLLPIAAPILAAAILIVAGTTRGYVSSLGHAYLGLIFTTYLLSHAVMLFDLPVGADTGADTGLGSAGPSDAGPSDAGPSESDPAESGVGAAGWFLFVVVLTETDDIMQALVGRRLGKHRLTPVVSPNKTWEGFAGGMMITLLLSVLLGSFLVALPWTWALVYGVILATAGLFGDLNMSAVKRDAGVKDSGNWLPGHGGLLDRVDSLTFTAPAVYYLTLLSRSVSG